MLKGLHLLLVALFVMVQSAAFLHVAVHGFEGHKHDGKACEIYEYCEHLALGDAPVMTLVLPLLVISFAAVAVLVGLVSMPRISVIQPRAPPLIA